MVSSSTDNDDRKEISYNEGNILSTPMQPFKVLRFGSDSKSDVALSGYELNPLYQSLYPRHPVPAKVRNRNLTTYKKCTYHSQALGHPL